MIEWYPLRQGSTSVHTNEWFLTSAQRRGTVLGATEARRDVRYVYSWQRTSKRLSLVENFTSHVNRLYMASNLQDQPMQASMEVRRLRSAVIDNIEEIYANDFDAVGERLVVRTQYDENANFHLGTPTSVFDRAIGQYYGGSTHFDAANVANWPEPTANPPAMPPALFSYALHGDAGSFSRPVSLAMTQGGDLLSNGYFFYHMGEGQREVPPPEVLLSRYHPYERPVDDIVLSEGACRDVSTSVVDAILAPIPVTQPQHAIAVVTALADDAARYVCSWTQFTNRDGRVTWTGNNYAGMALVTAQWDDAEAMFVVVEKRYAGNGELLEERWPIRADWGMAEPKKSRSYSRMCQWSDLEWRSHANLRTETMFPRDEETLFVSPTDRNVSPVVATELSLAYERRFNQLKRAQKKTLGADGAHLAHEIIMDYDCPVATPVDRCAPGIAVCDRMGAFRAQLEEIRFRLVELRTDFVCSNGCPSTLENDLQLILGAYTMALRELDLHVAADGIAPLETTLTGFSGFESAMVVDVAADDLISSLDHILVNTAFKAKFDSYRQVLDDSACQKPGACANELAELQSLVEDVAGTTVNDLFALTKLLPNDSVKELQSISIGLLDISTVNARSFFYSRVEATKQYTFKVKSSYTEKSRIAFIDSAIARIDAGLSVLIDVDLTLPRDMALTYGDIANTCGKKRHDAMRNGVPDDYRTTRFLWAANGAPAQITQEHGVASTLTYSNSGRGLLETTSSTLLDDDLDVVMDGPVCTGTGDPYAWLMNDRCGARATLEFGVEIQSIMAAQPGRRRTVSLLRNALADVVESIVDGDQHVFTRDSWGRLLKHTTPGQRASSFVYEAGEIVSTTSGTYPYEHSRTVSVVDADGHVVQSCTELFEGGCSAFQTPALGIDFTSTDCLDVAAYYRDHVRPLSLPEPEFQLTITKRSMEGLPVCAADPTGRIIELHRDSRGQVVDALDWNSFDRERTDARATSFAYDIDGRLTETIVAPSPSQALNAPLVESTRRDGFGRPAATRTSQGTIANVLYDHASRVTDMSVFAPDGATGTPTSHPTSQLLDAREGVFDAHGQLLSFSANNTTFVEVTYNRWGRAFRVEATGMAPMVTVTNADGRLLWRRDQSGDEIVAGEDPSNHRSFASVISKDANTTRGLHSLSFFDEDGFPTASRTFGRGDDGIVLERSTSSVYNGVGHLVSMVDAEGRTTVIDNNSLGWPLVTSVERQPGSGIMDDVATAYAAHGAALTIIDPSGAPTTYDLNGDGDVVAALYPNGEETGWGYDAFGRPAALTLTDGTTVEDLFDDRGNRTERWSGGSLLERFEHDDLGRLTLSTAFNQIGGVSFPVTESFAYDELDRVVLQGIALGNVKIATVSEWRIEENLWVRDVGLTTPYVPLHTDVFDGGGRLSARVGATWSRSFDYRGGNVGGSYAGDIDFEFASPRNAFGERVGLSASTGSVAHESEIVRDRIGRVLVESTSLTEPTKATDLWSAYIYGDRGRLEHAFTSLATGQTPPDATALIGSQGSAARSQVELMAASIGADDKEWSRSVVGSPMTLKKNGTVVESWVRTTGERLVGHTRNSVTSSIDHDPNQRVKTDGTHVFKFSPLDRLMQVEIDGAVVEGFAYTGTGRLAGVIRNGAVDEVFVHDGDHQIASVSPTGTVNWTATWGTQLNELVRFENNFGDTFVPVLDLRGSIVGGWLDDGTWTVTSHYDDQGRQSSPTGAAWCQADGERCAFVAGFPFGFTGAWVAESGILSLRHRWLSPELGQFLSADPLEYIDSFNRFAYAGFDPVNGVDPLGLGLKGTDADKGWAPSEPLPEPSGDDEQERDARVRAKAKYLLSSPDNPNPDLPENPRLTPGAPPSGLDRILRGAEDVLDDIADTVDDVVTTLVSAVVHEIGGQDIMQDGAKKVGDAAGAAAKFVVVGAAVVATDGIAGAAIAEVGGAAAGAAMEGAAARGAVFRLTAGKNFKAHFISKRPLLERALGIKVGKLSEGGGDVFLQAIREGIDNGTFEHVGQGTLRAGQEAMNIYRGKGLTVVTKSSGEWVTLLTSGDGMDLAIRMIP
jgi:RHS repeat-associated protein